MTTITTIPTHPTSVSSTSRFLKSAAGVAVGATLGWFAASAFDGNPPATAEPAAAVADVVPSPLVMSPDALTRWAESDAARSSGDQLVMSPDAMTHWAEADAARQQRENHAACERLSQGLADC